jgi:hypothetical protein
VKTATARDSWECGPLKTGCNFAKTRRERAPMICMRHFITEPPPGWKEKFGIIASNFASPPAARSSDGRLDAFNEVMLQPSFTHFWQRQCIYWLGFKYPLYQHRLHNKLCGYPD